MLLPPAAIKSELDKPGKIDIIAAHVKVATGRRPILT
jgi:hypothetical protein